MTTNYTTMSDDDLLELFAPNVTALQLLTLGRAAIEAQVGELLTEQGDDPTEAGDIADRIYEQALYTEAEHISGEVYAGIDDRRFHQRKETEIMDWLRDGDLGGNPTLDDLIAEWKEYDAVKLAD